MDSFCAPNCTQTLHNDVYMCACIKIHMYTQMYMFTYVSYVHVYICTYVHVQSVHVYNSVYCALHVSYMLFHSPHYGFYNEDASRKEGTVVFFQVSNVDSWGLVASKSVPLGCISRVNVCKYDKLASYPGQIFLLPHGLGMRLMANGMLPCSDK